MNSTRARCMTPRTGLLLAALLAVAPAFGQTTANAAAGPDSMDLGTKVPDAKVVKEGLFPEDSCKELEASGFRCMGVKPAIRFSLPASTFKLGSAELPDLLKEQLDVFADVLGSKRGSGRKVRIVGHADASGSAQGNQELSLRRAEAVRSYLVQKGADASMLSVVGVGATEPKNAADPLSAENRRVEIGRDTK